MMNGVGASLDTLLILVRKARNRVKRYEMLRNEGQNPVADRMLPEMFELRKELAACYARLLKAPEPEDQPTAEVMDQVQFLLRALAPGIRRPASTRQFKTVARRRREKVTEDTDTVVTAPAATKAPSRRGTRTRGGTRTRSKG